MKIIKTMLAAALFSVMFVSCGKNQNIVKDISVEERIDQDKVYIDVEAKLDLGNTVLIPGSFPINIPKKGHIGDVQFGVDFIKATVILSELVKLQLQNSVLPNGDPLPLIHTNQVVVIPLDKSGKSVIYISLVGASKAVGITLSIKELDKLGAGKSPASFFLPVKIKDFTIFAGGYSSPNAGENGLGVFVDLNPLFKILEAEGRWFEVHDGTYDQYQLNYAQIPISAKREKEFKKYFYKLHTNETKLHVGN